MAISEKIRSWARRIKRDGVTLWFVCKHPGTPLPAKALCAVIVAYALSPIDLIPDFIPVLGYLDDVILLPILIYLAIKLVPDSVLAECRIKASLWMERAGRRPRSNWGILFVLLVWVAAGWALWRYAWLPYLST
ncbi:MAG: YkvA family protein [Burkholderiaceae bacterium]